MSTLRSSDNGSAASPRKRITPWAVTRLAALTQLVLLWTSADNKKETSGRRATIIGAARSRKATPAVHVRGSKAPLAGRPVRIGAAACRSHASSTGCRITPTSQFGTARRSDLAARSVEPISPTASGDPRRVPPGEYTDCTTWTRPSSSASKRDTAGEPRSSCTCTTQVREFPPSSCTNCCHLEQLSRTPADRPDSLTSALRPSRFCTAASRCVQRPPPSRMTSRYSQ